MSFATVGLWVLSVVPFLCLVPFVLRLSRFYYGQHICNEDLSALRQYSRTAGIADCHNHSAPLPLHYAACIALLVAARVLDGKGAADLPGARGGEGAYRGHRTVRHEQLRRAPVASDSRQNEKSWGGSMVSLFYFPHVCGRRDLFTGIPAE